MKTYQNPRDEIKGFEGKGELVFVGFHEIFLLFSSFLFLHNVIGSLI